MWGCMFSSPSSFPKSLRMRTSWTLGVTPERIHDTQVCTYERPDYPSCRRAGSHLDAWQQTFSGIVLTQRMEQK